MSGLKKSNVLKVFFILFSVLTIFSSCNLPVPTGYYFEANIDGKYISCTNLSCTYDAGNNQMIINGTTLDGDRWTLSFFVPSNGSGNVYVSETDPYTYMVIEFNGTTYYAKEDEGNGKIIVIESGENVGDMVSGEFYGTAVNGSNSISVSSGEFSVRVDRVINFKKK